MPGRAARAVRKGLESGVCASGLLTQYSRTGSSHAARQDSRQWLELLLQPAGLPPDPGQRFGNMRASRGLCATPLKSKIAGKMPAPLNFVQRHANSVSLAKAFMLFIKSKSPATIRCGALGLPPGGARWIECLL
jgi:hypothetical protein